MKYAPIALFVYNRPEHTRLTVESLLKNLLVSESDLIVFSDGPKSEIDIEAVEQVRKYIYQVAGFKSVSIDMRHANVGLAHSIADGVTRVVNERGHVIVVEDDLVVSPYFLSYMNSALEYYQKEDKIMHISGYMFPIKSAGLPETFFLRLASCWGWATWSRAWKHFEKNPGKLLGEYSGQAIKRFNLDGAYNFWQQVENNASGEMDTWAVFWYASIFQQGGMCLHPRVSMVKNIGHDDTGTHCAKTVMFDVRLADKPITHFERMGSENVQVLKRLKAYFSQANIPFLVRIWRVARKRIFLNN